MILLTGASGFIGRNLLKGLRDFEVTAYSSREIENSRYLLRDNEYSPVSRKDFMDIQNSIEYIVHAGAYVPKNAQSEKDIDKITKNITHTQKLISFEYPKLKKFIYLSTLDVYKHTNQLITEESDISPSSLYAQSKYYSERMIQAWGERSGIPNQILRLGHVYGPGEDSYDKFIPKMMKDILKCNEVTVKNVLQNRRCYIYIQDVVDGIISAIKKDSCDTYNIVGNTNYTLQEILNLIITLSNSSVTIKKSNESNGRDFAFDNTKMIEELFRPKYDIAEGLKMEWEYFKYMKNFDV